MHAFVDRIVVHDREPLPVPWAGADPFPCLSIGIGTPATNQTNPERVQSVGLFSEGDPISQAF
jgi:hypothetical protein